MRSFSKPVIAALIGAVTLTSLPFTAAHASPVTSAPAKASTATEASDFSARARQRVYHRSRGRNNAAAIAAFGAVAGTIGAIAANERRRDYYERGYGYGGGYGGYGYGYAPRPYYGPGYGW